MPYEMSRDFAHPVSLHVMLSVSVAAPLFPQADVNETYKRSWPIVTAESDKISNGVRPGYDMV